MINLHKMTEKTVIDNKDIQYIGNKDQLISLIEKHSEKFKDPHFLIMRCKEKDEISLYSFEKHIDTIKLEIPKIFQDVIPD